MKAIEAFEEYCAAWANHDHIALADLFTDDGVFQASTLDAPIVGKENLRKQLRIISNSHTDIKTETRIAIETGAGAYFEGTYMAKITGTGDRIDGSATRADFRYVASIEMRDGKIQRLHEIYDSRPFYSDERQRMFPMNRLSPYWQGTSDAKCTEYSVYNNMYFPMIYSRAPYEDYAALIEGVTLWDVGLERQTQVKGKDALRFLDYLSCRDMSSMVVGDCRYTLLCDEKGIVLCDPVVLMPEVDTIWLSHGNTDVTLWARGIAMDSKWDVEVSEPDIAPLQVQGPESIHVMNSLCAESIDELKNYKCKITEVAGQKAVVSRTGWSGGFGYEIYPYGSGRAMELWNEVLNAGQPYGIKVTGPIVHRAVERGVTDTGYYTNSDMNALEEVSSHLVDVDKATDFIGKAALERIQKDGVRRHSVGLFIEGEVPRIEWNWKLNGQNNTVGEVRWAVHSFELNRSIGIAIVDVEIKIGDIVEIEYPLGTAKAEVTTIPFVGRGT
ncbi:MAG: glycine cleavage system aminomethyltransferase T/ketosteroid isomerase-like protein [Gammaproteobacteria bacterium]|jgi:glycine cleavage system aminomethyltransferase T/ketosteroid isomerase-like protein